MQPRTIPLPWTTPVFASEYDALHLATPFMQAPSITTIPRAIEVAADSTDYVNAKRGVSRVVLLRRSDGRIWDLTRLVEAHDGVAVGTFGAMMPTASSPSVA
jgi:hypothetical protein